MLKCLSQSKTSTYTMPERSNFSIKSNQNSGMHVDDIDLPIFLKIHLKTVI